jgi:hypothetical protein
MDAHQHATGDLGRRVRHKVLGLGPEARRTDSAMPPFAAPTMGHLRAQPYLLKLP